VEGKEKLKLVVDRTYNGHKELQSSMFDIDALEETDSQNDDEEIDFSDEMQLDTDLVHDIEELAEEEKKMLQTLDPDADDADNAIVESSSQQIDSLDKKLQPYDANPVDYGLGKSEDDAISLSDDEGEDPSNDGVSKQSISSVTTGANTTAASGNIRHGNVTSTNSSQIVSAIPNDIAPLTSEGPYDNIFSGCRLYRMIFGEMKLGLEVTYHEGRIIVASLTPERVARFGPNSKPSVGDILCGFDGKNLGLIADLKTTLIYLKALLYKHPVEVLFIEAPKFIAAFCNEIRKKNHPKPGINMMVPTTYKSTASLQQQPDTLRVDADARRLSIVPPPKNDVIELLDD
jgi:hypothetical protein